MEGSMSRRMVIAILLLLCATVLLTIRSSVAGAAADDCLAKPGASAPAGSHWYYRINRADHRHCWYLGPVGAKVRAPARETASSMRSVSRGRAAETARVTGANPTPAEPEQAAPAAAELAEPRLPEDATPEFAARWPDLPSAVGLGAREPSATSSSYAEE